MEDCLNPCFEAAAAAKPPSGSSSKATCLFTFVVSVLISEVEDPGKGGQAAEAVEMLL